MLIAQGKVSSPSFITQAWGQILLEETLSFSLRVLLVLSSSSYILDESTHVSF